MSVFCISGFILFILDATNMWRKNKLCIQNNLSIKSSKCLTCQCVHLKSSGKTLSASAASSRYEHRGTTSRPCCCLAFSGKHPLCQVTTPTIPAHLHLPFISDSNLNESCFHNQDILLYCFEATVH